jgi:DNA-binding CsgD family transcriptional regulator
VDRIVRTELDLIGHIYDAVFDPVLWNDTIDRIRRYLGLYIGVISALHRPTGISIQATTNISPDYLRIMAEEVDSLPDLWGGFDRFSRFPLEEPIRMTDYVPLEQMAGNRYYERVGRPQGLVDQIVLILELDASMVATLGMGLHESMPPIDENQLETFRILAPHMRRAVRISNLLETRSILAASLEATLDALGSAVLLVDDDLAILYANQRAEAMLHAGDPITSIRGRLDVPRELAKGLLERSVAAATLPGQALGPASGIPVRRRDGSGAIVHVLPLRQRATGATSRAVAAVFVAEPNTALNLPLEGIQALYDLRPAEVRVLELIAAGSSGRGVAEALGISQNTAKTHTLRLFDKLGIHTRAELVRFAREMAVAK